MKINIIFIPVIRTSLRFSDRMLIEKTIRTHARRAAKLLNLKTEALTFTLHPHWWGWGGEAESKEWVRLKIPLRWKSKKHRAEFISKNLPAVVYHELHHLGRRYVFSPEKNYLPHRLANSLVSEGLAIAFSEEQVPGYCARYGVYRTRAIRKWFPAIRREKWSRNYDERAWFHGKGKPQWLGYRIGKYIIDQLKKRHPRLTARRLVREKTVKILKLSGVKL